MVNNRRNITQKLILTLLIICMSVSPAFANVNVEIEYNDNEYFHAYNSNTNVANSYIDSGAAVFSKALNYMFVNIAKGTSTLFAMSTYLNNTLSTKLDNINSNINTVNTGLGNITNTLGSVRYDIAGVRQDTQQVYSKLNTISNQISNLTNSGNLNWIDRSLTASYYNTLADAVAGTNPAANGSRYKIFVKLVFDDYYPYNDALFIEFPIFPYGPLSFSDHTIYIDKAYCPNNDQTGATLLSDKDMYFYYDDFTTCSSAYIDGLGRTNNSGFYDITRRTLILEITSTQYFYCVVGTQSAVKSLDFLSQDYITFMDYMNVESIDYNLKNLHLESSFDDSDIIDAINNLSLQDNDVKLNLIINNNTGSDGTNIITRLQNFFNTGVSVGDFFTNVDDAESGWFTQSNSDVINTLRGGYTNFYE